MALAPLSTGFQSLPLLPTIKLGPSGARSRVGGLVHTLGPCGYLQRPLLWGWESLLLLPQPPWTLSLRGLRLYFPALEPWVTWSASLPAVSSQFICARVWGRGVCQWSVCLPSLSHTPPVSILPGQLESSPPRCPSPPLLLVWRYVSFLSTWCWTSLLFDFLSVLIVGGGAVCLPTPPSWFPSRAAFLFQG